MYKKFSGILLAAILSTSAVATTSSVVHLDGGTAKPNQSVSLNFDRLLEEVSYNVTCNISSNNVAKQQYNIVQVIDYNSRKKYLDEYPLGIETMVQAELPTNRTVTFEYENIYNYSNALTIRNLDDTDTITVSNCVARPKVANP